MISFKQGWNKINLQESKKSSGPGKSKAETPVQDLAWLVGEQGEEQCSRWSPRYARWTTVASGSWLEMRIQEAHFRSTEPTSDLLNQKLGGGGEPRSLL